MKQVKEISKLDSALLLHLFLVPAVMGSIVGVTTVWLDATYGGLAGTLGLVNLLAVLGLMIMSIIGLHRIQKLKTGVDDTGV